MLRELTSAGRKVGEVRTYWYDRNVSRYWCVNLRLRLRLNGSIGRMWRRVHLGLLVRVSWILSRLLFRMLNWCHRLSGGTIWVCISLALRWDGADRWRFRC